MSKKKIKYVEGDATKPIGDGIIIIAHICNDIGGWGKGFVLAISKKWKKPEMKYKEWYKMRAGFKLGEIQLVEVEEDIFVANMIGQKGIKKTSKDIPIRYKAVDECLAQLGEKSKEIGASVHMPRIGCGLSGGEWSEIEPLIEKNLLQKGIDVVVYDFK